MSTATALHAASSNQGFVNCFFFGFRRHNVSLLAYSPLAGGALSGKYVDGNAGDKARFNLFAGARPRADVCARISVCVGGGGVSNKGAALGGQARRSPPPPPPAHTPLHTQPSTNTHTHAHTHTTHTHTPQAIWIAT